MKDVFVLSAVRSAIGSFDGSLSMLEPIDLGATVMREAINRSAVNPELISSSVVGNCIPESRSPYVARVISITAGLTHNSSALTVNRLCGSAMQAVISIAQSIRLGDTVWNWWRGRNYVKGRFLNSDLMFWKTNGNTSMIAVVAVLTDPFGVGHMGVTAENLAKKWNITREMQDEFALTSQSRAKCNRIRKI